MTVTKQHPINIVIRYKKSIGSPPKKLLLDGMELVTLYGDSRNPLQYSGVEDTS